MAATHCGASTLFHSVPYFLKLETNSSARIRVALKRHKVVYRLNLSSINTKYVMKIKVICTEFFYLKITLNSKLFYVFSDFSLVLLKTHSNGPIVAHSKISTFRINIIKPKFHHGFDRLVHLKLILSRFYNKKLFLRLLLL